jgi:hypothetical protein
MAIIIIIYYDMMIIVSFFFPEINEKKRITSCEQSTAVGSIFSDTSSSPTFHHEHGDSFEGSIVSIITINFHKSQGS